MKGMKYPPFAKPVPAAKPAQHAAAEELPSIEDFLDELPPIDDYLASDPPALEPESVLAEEPDQLGETEAPQQPAPPGWAPGEWQSYDWNSMSRLATPVAPRPALQDDSLSSSSDEVAAELEGIARRIRSGELVIDNLHGTPPEAAMATALAIVLRMQG